MFCPKCNVKLRMGDRAGVEIDYCPASRGILARPPGQLETIIERSSPSERQVDSSSDRIRDYDDDDEERRDRIGRHDGDHLETGVGSRRRRSFLGDLFDIG